MFEVGFSELTLIMVLALVVLGPERLPKVVSQVGRWMGRARAMARQFREQLDDEVTLDPTPRRAGKKKAAGETANPSASAAAVADVSGAATADVTAEATADVPADGAAVSPDSAPTSEDIDADTRHNDYSGADYTPPDVTTPEVASADTVASDVNLNRDTALAAAARSSADEHRGT